MYLLDKIGRGEKIRTSGPCLPKTVLSQTGYTRHSANTIRGGFIEIEYRRDSLVGMAFEKAFGIAVKLPTRF